MGRDGSSRLVAEPDLRDVIRLIPGYDPYKDTGGATFDVAAAAKAIQFFHECLTHVKGEKALEPLILEPWQQAIIANLFGWLLPDGMRRYKESLVYIPRKNGKLLPLDTCVPTPSGWTTIGDVQVGALLFDERGVPCNVVWASPIDPDPESFLLTFSNGEQVKACAEHQWLTTARVDKPGDKSSGRGKRPLTRIRTTLELFATQVYGSRGDRNHTIAMPGPLVLPERNLLINPYVLGCWLGDGTSAGAELTADDSDAAHFVEQFASRGFELRRKKMLPNKAPQFSIRKLMPGLFGPVVATLRDAGHFRSDLRTLDLFNNKHIPALYLRASFAQRLELLQGLMDTDGTADKHGRALEFTTVLPRLRDGFCELLASLGVKYRCREKEARIEGRVTGPCYRIQFFVSPDVMPVFRMRRKLERIPRASERGISQRSRTVSIVSIEPCESVPMRCIAVDSPSNLYLFGRSMLPTHNTTLAAGIPLYVLFCDPERGKEIYAAAADRKQAGILFGISKRMVFQEPAFEGHANVLKHSITREYDGSFFQAVSADADTKHGYNASVVVVDELHAQKNSDLVEVLETSVGSRRQPIFLSITTADLDLPIEESVCNRKHKYACDVRDGHISDPEFLPVIYEALSERDDWKDPEVWQRVNPNWNVSLFPHYFERKFKQAHEQAIFENPFKRLHLNLRTEQAIRWLKIDEWDVGGRQPVDIEALKGRACYGGLDLATIRDIAAFVLLFPLNDGTFAVLPYFWAPRDTASERERRSKAKYITWNREGLVELTPGDSIDFEYIRSRLVALRRRYRIKDIAYDDWNAHHIVSQLIEVDGFRMTPNAQGYKGMSSGMKMLAILARTGRIRHGGHKVLRWMVSNLAADQDNHDNVKPNKKRSTDKIDGVVALIMAINVSGIAEEKNPYVGRGFISV